MRNIKKIVAFIVTYNSLLNASTCFADFYDASTTAIESRIAPIGKIKITSKTSDYSPLPTTNHLGKKLFESHCILCHGNGIAGAPRFGNKTDWQGRIKKKLSLLLKHVKNGYRAMPPKGACLECSSKDLEEAIHYMIDHSS